MADSSDPWTRFRRLMGLVVIAAAITVVGSLYWLQYAGVHVPLFLAIMVAVGVFLTVLLAGALMGLVFVSNRSGIDHEIDDHSRPDID
jgi:hypothetical protein